MNLRSVFSISGRKLAFFLATSIAAAQTFAGPIDTIENGGFETPIFNANAYEYLGGQTVGGWTFTGPSGIVSSYFAPGASGNQAAMIEPSGASIAQTFDSSGGTFLINFLAKLGTPTRQEVLVVLIDGQEVMFDGGLSSDDMLFHTYSSDAITLSAGQHVLSFVGLPPRPDYSAKIDDVMIRGVDVPEPASIALLGIGLLGITTLRRNKNR